MSWTPLYGWPNDLQTDEILRRLVALHDLRVREENQGLVRWLRPDYQKPRFGTDLPEQVADVEPPPPIDEAVTVEPRVWPDELPQQLAALQEAITEGVATLSSLRTHFPKAKRTQLVQHLEALTVLGLVRVTDDERYVIAKTQTAPAA